MGHPLRSNTVSQTAHICPLASALSVPSVGAHHAGPLVQVLPQIGHPLSLYLHLLTKHIKLALLWLLSGVLSSYWVFGFFWCYGPYSQYFVFFVTCK